MFPSARSIGMAVAAMLLLAHPVSGAHAKEGTRKPTARQSASGREGRAQAESLSSKLARKVRRWGDRVLGSSGQQSRMSDSTILRRPERDGRVLDRTSGLIETLQSMDNNPQRRALLADVARPEFDSKAVERLLQAHGKESRSEDGTLIYHSGRLGGAAGVRLDRMGPGKNKDLRFTIFEQSQVGHMPGLTHGAKITVRMSRDGTIRGVNAKGHAELLLKELAESLANGRRADLGGGKRVDTQDLLAITNYLAPKALDRMLTHPKKTKGLDGELEAFHRPFPPSRARQRELKSQAAERENRSERHRKFRNHFETISELTSTGQWLDYRSSGREEVRLLAEPKERAMSFVLRDTSSPDGGSVTFEVTKQGEVRNFGADEAGWALLRKAKYLAGRIQLDPAGNTPESKALQQELSSLLGAAAEHQKQREREARSEDGSD